mgnify:CR=1 FL=1
MKNNKNKKIGILGGSFDPAHKGHIKISIEAKKKFKINKIIWAVTRKNPFKSEAVPNMASSRIILAPISGLLLWISITCPCILELQNKTVEIKVVNNIRYFVFIKIINGSN